MGEVRQEDEFYEYRRQALEDYEALLNTAQERNEITGREHDEALARFQRWVEIGTTALMDEVEYEQLRFWDE